jgi:hypothetical protein
MADAAKASPVDSDIWFIRLAEIDAINQRRHKLGRSPLDKPANPLRSVDAVGLALSGGGVRSASVCLGVMQALNHHDAIRNIDYLSTVSGGGYAGSALSASMSATGGDFVFGERRTNPNAPLSSEIKDTEAFKHIRNYSNYLIPGGMRDLVTAAAIVVRGLVANIALVLPVLLLLAALMVHSNPNRSNLFVSNIFGHSLGKYIPISHFGITLTLVLAGLGLFLIWALIRSWLPPNKHSEFRGWLPFLGASYLIVIAVSFVCELQPFVVAGMFEASDQLANPQDALVALVTGWVKSLAAIATPIAAVVTFFRKQIGDMLKSTTAESHWSKQLFAVVSKGLVWVAGAALPLLIWIGFLYLCYWGIINDKAVNPQTAACPPAVSGTVGTVNVDRTGPACGGNIDIKLRLDGCSTCAAAPLAGPMTANQSDPQTRHTPDWLLAAAQFVSKTVKGYVISRPLWLLYLVVGLIVLVLSWLLKPNANSLHRLYRDRLSKAFLFDPREFATPDRVTIGEPSRDQGRDFKPLDTLRMSELDPRNAPYHLVNAALNIQGSDYANRRGRNADFFIFSPKYIGSEATDYAPMPEFERAAPQLDLATAMAISGAAASSNMGSNTIRPLTPTLAFLNVRLGYWLKNPMLLSPTQTRYPVGICSRIRAWLRFYEPVIFLWAEITGRLYENAEAVYLTDGGHIENLGIYELLRRRCRVIIAVDAEADSSMHFPSFITLERYARLDLGVRIDLPWEPIRETTLALMDPPQKDSKPVMPEASFGPHVAVGKIDYGGGEIGYLVYIKSSLTGDENDYIRDYARRYSSFPHESTGDQFFSEEQFEVYRALGFHMMHAALSGDDNVRVQVDDVEGGEAIKFTDQANDMLRRVRAALLG